MNQEIIGKFVSEILYSDINIVGKVVGAYGKTGIIIQKMNATRDTIKKEYIKGGFSFICLNNSNQEWEFELTDILVKHRLGKKWNKQYMLFNNPTHYYDYNF